MSSRDDVVTLTPEELRRALDGRTQRWLARVSGVNEKTVSNIARGHVRRTNKAHHDAILRALLRLSPLIAEREEVAVD